MKIVIIDYDAGNTQSVQFALERMGKSAIITSDKEDILCADKVIFPGVGQAKAAMDSLKKYDLDILIPQLQQGVLGICLGMQLLCENTEEGNIKGLGVFENNISIIPEGNIVPHTGWNQISGTKNPLFEGIKENEFMYFVHSYYANLSSCTIATTHYHEPFSAALQKDNFFGCQFHPEKSGEPGQKILQNFLNM